MGPDSTAERGRSHTAGGGLEALREQQLRLQQEKGTSQASSWNGQRRGPEASADLQGMDMHTRVNGESMLFNEG